MRDENMGSDQLQPIIDVGTLQAMGKAIEESKAEDELARLELSPEEERAVIRRVLQGTYADADPRTIDAAVDAQFAKRFEFEPPDRPSLLAGLYVSRGPIALAASVLLLLEIGRAHV